MISVLLINEFKMRISLKSEVQAVHVRDASLQMTIEMYPSDQVADLRAEVTHWYENLQKEQMNQQAQLQEFGQSGRQQGDFPGWDHLGPDVTVLRSVSVSLCVKVPSPLLQVASWDRSG